MESPDCGLCSGTGIGQSGPPDTSRCSACGGSGVARDYDDMDPDYLLPSEPDDGYLEFERRFGKRYT